MAGLLGDVLPWVYSRGNALKRGVSGLLADPIGTAQQAAGLLQDQHRETNRLMDVAFSDPEHPFRPTNQQAMNALTERMLSGPLGFAPAGITVWHGSPHVFNKFDSSKIGTGEGSQAYGHGLYVSEKAPVARNYQNMEKLNALAEARGLTNAEYDEANRLLKRANAEGVSLADVVRSEAEHFRSLGGDWGNATARQLESMLTKVEPQLPKTSGNLYKADLSDAAVPKMLDFDKRMSEQPPAVREALGPMMEELKSAARRAGLPDEDFYGGHVLNILQRPPGMLSGKPGVGPVEVAQRLRASGIPGVRYLDRDSRMMGSGSSNFVVFPGEERILNLLERNGQPLR